MSIREPAMLAGTTNGDLPDRVLWSTGGLDGGPVVTLCIPAARSWRAMSDAAYADGIVLRATSVGDSYRSYARQVDLFLRRFTTQKVSKTRRWWRGQWWYLLPDAALAAVPGTSNHGDGLAIDLRYNTAILAWLLANARRFGWSWEEQSEPWHLHYYTGDFIPQAVRDYETGQHPDPDPEPDPAPDTRKDDDMAFIASAASNNNWWLMEDRGENGTRTLIPGEDKDNAVLAGLTLLVGLSDPAFDRIARGRAIIQ